MKAAFSDAAAAWVAAGVIPLPLGGEDGKRPLVRNPSRLGARAALQIAARPRFAEATGLGFWCGKRNELTIVDIDSTADAELQRAIDRYGDSPVIVKTGGDKAHLYYRHAGERRSIRPDKERPVDILGEGGLAVAPPSERPTGGRYRFLRGGLGDLRNLPKIRAGAIAQLHETEPPDVGRFQGRGVHDDSHDHNEPEQVLPGGRNASMFKLACQLGNTAADSATLLDQMRRANADLSVPLPDDEIMRLVGSVWAYRNAGRLMAPGLTESTLLLPVSIADHAFATGNLDVAGLMMLVRRYHSVPGKTFALSPVALSAANTIKGWSPNRYRYAIREAIDLGLLAQVHMGGRGKHDPSLYRLPLRVR